MKELMYLGKEVKNSWGTVATSDRFIKNQPKLLAAFMRAVLKALRSVRQDRDGAIAVTDPLGGQAQKDFALTIN